MTFGVVSSSWRARYGLHASISSGSGSRLPGGRHMTTLMTRTSSRCMPESPRAGAGRGAGRSDRRTGSPARPPAGPGPSPMKSRSASGSPRPNTTWVRPAASPHRVQVRASSATSSSSVGTSRARLRRRSARRRPVTARPSTHVGGDGCRTTHGLASTAPVAAATRASPSPAVWAGSRARAKPSWPAWATSRQSSFVSRALVATTPTVVASPSVGERLLRRDAGRAARRRRGARRRR